MSQEVIDPWQKPYVDPDLEQSAIAFHRRAVLLSSGMFPMIEYTNERVTRGQAIDLVNQFMSLDDNPLTLDEKAYVAKFVEQAEDSTRILAGYSTALSHIIMERYNAKQ